MLSGVVTCVMGKYRVVPDTSIPEKIMKETEGEMFYVRGELGGLIMSKVLKQSGGGEGDDSAATNWIDSLLRSQDFFSVRVKREDQREGEGRKEAREFICTDLQKFGRDLLSTLIELSNEIKSEWTLLELEGTNVFSFVSFLLHHELIFSSF